MLINNKNNGGKMEEYNLMSAIEESMPVIAKMKEVCEETEKLEKIKAKSGIRGMCILGGPFMVFCFILGICGLFDLDFTGAFICLGLSGTFFYWVYYRRKRFKKCCKRIEELDQEQKKLSNDDRLSWISINYRYYYSLTIITGYITNGRADSVKEAINLFEKERREMVAVNAAVSAAEQARNADALGTVISIIRRFK